MRVYASFFGTNSSYEHFYCVSKYAGGYFVCISYDVLAKHITYVADFSSLCNDADLSENKQKGYA